MADHTGITDHKYPDYQLEQTLALDRPEQYRALFEETRLQIVDLILDRAANIKELAEALDKPKGTVGHHVAVLEEAGLIRVVRTEKIRAIEAKYYGRIARTYLLSEGIGPEVDLSPAHFLTEAATEYAASAQQQGRGINGPMSTLRHVRIPAERAAEWAQRLLDLTQEFTAEERGGDTVYGLLVAFYPTDRPRLPERAIR